MRVNRRLQRVREDERGAVLMMVALLLFALIGMLVLVFDLGRTVAVRRDQVNAADAAALAAAQQCALGNGFPAAQTAATTLNASNSTTGATISLFAAPECDTLASANPKLVTVESTTTIDYFFAQIFGFTSGDITTRAVAQWGPANSVSSPVPIYLDNASLAPCIADPHPSVPVQCSFLFNNEPVSSQFGWLNFPEGWNTTSCNSEGGSNDISEYIDPAPLPDDLVFDATITPTPGFVMACGQPGEIASQVVNALAERAASSDPFLTFPVTDFERFPPVPLGGNQFAYKIVGYTKLQVLAALKGNDILNDPECAALLGDQKINSSMFCIRMQWTGKQVGGGIPGTGLSYGLDKIRLVD